ncbi:MAG: ArsA-related P-loop ATPase [Actinomycetales bacterium]
MTRPLDPLHGLHVVSGKGGTGKTAVATALAVALADAGLRVLLAEVEQRHGTEALLGVQALDAQERLVAHFPGGGRLSAVALDPRAAMQEYLERYYRLGLAGRIAEKAGAVDFAASIAPGLRDVLITGKVYDALDRPDPGTGDPWSNGPAGPASAEWARAGWAAGTPEWLNSIRQAAAGDGRRPGRDSAWAAGSAGPGSGGDRRSGRGRGRSDRSTERPYYDAIVLDAPPTGRVTNFLNVNTEVSGLARVGPVHNQAAKVSTLMHSPRTRVHLVALPEEMPVTEAVDAIAELSDAGLHPGAIFLNQVREPVLTLAALRTAEGGEMDVATMAGELAHASEPGGPLDGLDPARLARSLVDEATEHANRIQLQRDLSGVLKKTGLPLLSMPYLLDGLNPRTLTALVDAIVHEALPDQAGATQQTPAVSATSPALESNADALTARDPAVVSSAGPADVEHRDSHGARGLDQVGARKDPTNSTAREGAAARVSQRLPVPGVELDLLDLVSDLGVQTVVCCGSGGVGKTTTAAALAVAAAEAGRQVVVLTIDPARRLAQSLGLSELDNTPRPVAGVDTSAGGGLDAMMLDMKRTFDEVVEASANPERAETILANPFYVALSSSFAGTSEYMAMEKLGQLRAEADAGQAPWDLIIVDTPPSRSALDFLDAPARLSSFLDGRFIRLLTAPARTGGRVYVRALSGAVGGMAAIMTRLLGASFVADVQTFITATDTMFGGFRERAEATYAQLSSPGTAFVVVCGAQEDTITEARYFVDRLAQDQMPLAGVVVNRVQPVGAPGLSAERALDAAALLARGSRSAGPARRVSVALLRLHAQRARRRDAELALVAEFTARYPKVPAVCVDSLPTDVHDLDGLRQVAARL